jgi:hypothetical protein
MKLQRKTLKDISDSSTHKSNHLPLEIKPFSAHNTSDELSTDSSTQILDFSLRERKKKPAHNNETKSTKLERLRSARLIHRDPNTMNSRHAKASSKITDSSLLATIINYFKHYY